MFVVGNELSDIKKYFSDKLQSEFSRNEIKNILKALTIKRFKISDLDYFTYNTKLSESDLLYYHFALKRILKNEPVQYVLGTTEFYGLELIVEPGILIPRPETEELVDWIVKEHSDLNTIIDICSGSGCIAFSLESKFPKVDIYGLEYSKDALKVAGKNKEHLKSHVVFKEFNALDSDSYSAIENTDLWVSNPPYIPNSDKSLMGDNVLEFEPHIALFVEDDDALKFYRSISDQGIKRLVNGGWLYFEIHEEYGSEVADLMRSLGFVNIELRKDLQGKDRMIRGQKLL